MISAVLSLFQVDVVSYAVDVRHMFFITFIFSSFLLFLNKCLCITYFVVISSFFFFSLSSASSVGARLPYVVVPVFS